jgi:hypothetical protein
MLAQLWERGVVLHPTGLSTYKVRREGQARHKNRTINVQQMRPCVNDIPEADENLAPTRANDLAPTPHVAAIHFIMTEEAQEVLDAATAEYRRRGIPYSVSFDNLGTSGPGRQARRRRARTASSASNGRTASPAGSSASTPSADTDETTDDEWHTLTSDGDGSANDDAPPPEYNFRPTPERLRRARGFEPHPAAEGNDRDELHYAQLQWGPPTGPPPPPPLRLRVLTPPRPEPRPASSTPAARPAHMARELRLLAPETLTPSQRPAFRTCSGKTQRP